jgi:hypothetical protein
MTKPQGDMPELFPCPFCGGEAKTFKQEWADNSITFASCFGRVGNWPCIGYVSNVTVEQWQTRASPPPQPTAQGDGARALEVFDKCIGGHSNISRVQDYSFGFDDAALIRKVLKQAALHPAPVPEPLGEDEYVSLMMQTDRGKTFEETYKNQYRALVNSKHLTVKGGAE